MKLEGERVLCRLHVTSHRQAHHQPIYEWVVERARARGMAGATVLRGAMGFCGGGDLLPRHPWLPGQEVPVVVELVDRAEAIDALLLEVLPEAASTLVTLERAHVVIYRARGGPAPAPTEAPLTGGEAMGRSEEGVLLRIFVGDADTDPGTGRPLYEALVLEAREQGLWGATVLRGCLGFGGHSRLHAAKLLDISTDLPVVVEIVDTEERIDAFLPHVDARVDEGLVTLEKVRIVRYAADPRS